MSRTSNNRPKFISALGLLALACGGTLAAAQPMVLESSWGVSGSDAGEIGWPRGLAWGGGTLYVAEWSNARVSRFSEDGAFLTTWGTRGTAPGAFDLPIAIALDRDGQVYTSEANLADRIQKFEGSGAWLGAWGTSGSAPGEFDAPSDLAVAHDAVHVVDSGNDRIQKFSRQGVFVDEWTWDDAPLGFMPSQIAVSPNGDVYVVEKAWNRIQRFAANGQHLASVVTGGQGAGFISEPSDLAIDGSGNLYVTESGATKRLQKFAADGTFLAQLLFAQSVCPEALAVSGSDLLFVADDCSDRILVVRDGSVGIFTDGFESGDTSSWSGSVP